MKQEQKTPPIQKRKLKVYAKCFSRAYFGVAVFPEIRLAGKWLHNTGFHCGKNVAIQYEQNKIVITLVDS